MDEKLRECPVFEFDRYINGQLMAEGVTIEREAELADAMRKAAQLASRGPNGEVPVLVLIPRADNATIEALRERVRVLEADADKVRIAALESAARIAENCEVVLILSGSSADMRETTLSTGIGSRIAKSIRDLAGDAGE